MMYKGDAEDAFLFHDDYVKAIVMMIMIIFMIIIPFVFFTELQTASFSLSYPRSS